jgi:BASS family bile acid:Na+ symporter
MTLAQAIPVAISISIFLMVMTIGLSADLRDATFLLRRPGLFARSVLTMNVVMVVFAAAMCLLFDVGFATEVAILTIAVSPVPPIMPRKQLKAGGDGSYAIGLLVAEVLLAIVLVPLSIEFIGKLFGVAAHAPIARVLPIVLISVIAPLVLGILVRRLAPDLAGRMVRPMSLAATILLVAAVLPILFSVSGTVWDLVGKGGLAVLLLFALLGLAVGHQLGGPDPADRPVLALAASARHPGMALAIATLNFQEQKPEIMAVIVCHLLISALMAAGYIAMLKRGRRVQVG